MVAILLVHALAYFVHSSTVTWSDEKATALLRIGLPSMRVDLCEHLCRESRQGGIGWHGRSPLSRTEVKHANPGATASAQGAALHPPLTPSREGAGERGHSIRAELYNAARRLRNGALDP